MITIFHVSDLHVTNGVLGSQHDEGVEALLMKLKNAIESTEGEKVVIVTGDLTNAGSKGQYKLVRKYLSGLPCNIRIVPGNHDIGDNLGTDFDIKSAQMFDALASDLGFGCSFIGKYNEKYPGYKPYTETMTSDDGSTVTLIYLNSCCEVGSRDFAVGTLGAYQLNCLVDILRSHDPNVPVIICLHHKPMTVGTPVVIMDLNVEDRKYIRQIVEEFNVRALLYGHQLKSSDIAEPHITNDGGKCYLVDANDSVKDCSFYKIEVMPDCTIGEPKLFKFA